MKIILSGTEGGPVKLSYASPRTLKAFTHGGFGALPGDAVTVDLEENEAARVEASRAMPKQRAIDNMVRAGHDTGFAERWCDAMIAGGETEASAMEMIAAKTHPGETNLGALDLRRRPRERYFRDAWRRAGDAIVVDIEAARRIFAERLIAAKGQALKLAGEAAEVATLLGQGDDGGYAALTAINLRAIGAKLMKADSPSAILSLWPDGLER